MSVNSAGGRFRAMPRGSDMRQSGSPLSVEEGRRAVVSGGRQRRAAGSGRLPAIEYGDRQLPAPPTSSYARYVGRVGALAIALGVGAAIGSMPAVACADTTGSPVSTGSSSSSPSSSAAAGSGGSTSDTGGGGASSRGSVSDGDSADDESRPNSAGREESQPTGAGVSGGSSSDVGGDEESGSDAGASDSAQEQHSDDESE